MRLIDADALKELICNNVYPVQDFLNSRDYGMFWTGGIEKAIDEMPTLNAEPVRHGKWDDTRVAFFRICSECGATVKNNLPDVFLDCDIRDLHYCPNCGAKMDEVEE